MSLLTGVNIAQIKVYLETQEDSAHVYQNFRIVAPEIHLLRYFTDEMYLGYHALERAMSKYYVGDGETIIFRKKFRFNNLTTLTFDKTNPVVEIRPELISAQFMVETTIPATHGCLDCEHFRPSNRMCMYYQTLGIKIRKNCPDFRQKEERNNMSESNANLILEIANKLGTTVDQLLAEYGDADIVVEMYKAGTLKLLSEEK